MQGNRLAARARMSQTVSELVTLVVLLVRSRSLPSFPDPSVGSVAHTALCPWPSGVKESWRRLHTGAERGGRQHDAVETWLRPRADVGVEGDRNHKPSHKVPGASRRALGFLKYGA